MLSINVRNHDDEHQTQHTDDVRMFIWVLVDIYTWRNNETNVTYRPNHIIILT